MSELTQDNRRNFRWELLTTVSALALVTYVSSTAAAKAEDKDHPVLWLEVSGGPEFMQGISAPFSADFMFPETLPPQNVYGDRTFLEKQKPSRFAFDGDAKITLQPEDSDWKFSIDIRYARSNKKEHTHYQGTTYNRTDINGFAHYAAAFSDSQLQGRESHLLVDFSAGKDVGLGLFGSNGSSTVSAGIRFAQFTAKSSTHITARPHIGYTSAGKYNFPYFNQYVLDGKQSRSFTGVGPSLSWNASAAIAGTPDSTELTLDWGLSAAVLFGRQKARIDHQTAAYYFLYGNYQTIYKRGPYSQARSHSVVVPEVSGFIGLSAKLPRAKVSIGYRGDIWFGASDTGIDTRKTSDLTFHGPYASISIGLGG